MAQKKAVIFDMYGTLLHLTERTQPYAALFKGLGIWRPDALAEARRVALTENFSGLPALVERVAPGHDLDLAPYTEAVVKELASAALFPETLDVLETLQSAGFRLGTISNLATPYKQAFFALGLERFFNARVFSCDDGVKKPQPQSYHRMLDLLGVGVDEAVMVGDSFWCDVQGPRDVGMSAVYLDRSRSVEDAIANLEGIFAYL